MDFSIIDKSERPRKIAFGSGNHARYFSINYPNKCPVCHHYSEIEYLRGETCVSPTNSGQVLFQCAYKPCRSFFLALYRSLDGASELDKFTPVEAPLEGLPNCINELSSSFIEIHKEAAKAELYGLKQIAGPGYRKAFEFLVKDYAKSKLPEDEHEKIERMPSSAVVKEYIQDPRIEKVAKRALWLGNDETHYLRKWNSHDLSDLKNLITLTTRWVEMEVLSAGYEEQMP